MKSKVLAGNFAIPQVSALSLALSLVFASLSVHAAVADTSTWVATKTQAFLPQVQANQKSLAADASVATPAASAVQLAQGEQVHVTLSLNLRNEAKLDKFLQDLHTPGTASYGKFLKPAQFAALYAPTEKDVAAVVAHLSKSGFVNIRISPNRQLVFADGTAATVQTAFRTSLKRFQQDGRNVFANTDAAQVPAALGNIVGSVLGLQNVAVAQTHHRWIPNTEGSVALQAKAKAKPSATPVATPHSPAQFPSIYNAGSTPTASNTTVAIISEGNIDPTITDLGTFTSANGFATVNTSVVQTGPAGSDYSDTSGQVEWNLDSQTITGTSGGAVQQLIFYASPDMNFSSITASYNQAVSDNLAKVINVSLGGCESDTHSDGTQAADDNVFKQAVAQGQTFSISTGDAGTYNCQTSSISGAPGVPKNKSTYDVSEPASSPYVIAVGGTTLYTTSGAYSSETVWNEGLSAIGVYDANGDSDPTKRLWATGGGYSKYEAAPSYQSGVIAAGKTTRGLPDIAFDAASASGATIYYNGQTGTVGGTSLAAPIFTGTWARLQSANGNALGFPAASFYKYFPLAANAALLHDVTSGTNGASSSYGYKAAKGWDATTGFGSLNIANLNTFIHNTSDFAR
ncbi:protease pro-enzyme activation domain-containing protein [Collimonas sp. NPDC087041]|uniref:S53 family peptidase n=1 Tax=Collimonas sp. NPDC087041 TaxID=3363960 RepID=UPI00380A947C